MTVAPADRRDLLLEIGADLFMELGYTETSLRTIAERAGMKAGSIYYHFESKDILLTEILRIGMERITAAHEAAVRQVATPAAQLGRAIEAHLRALFAHGPFTAAHVTVFNRAPAAVRAVIVPWRDAYERRWADLFRSLHASGAIRADVDLQFARLTLLGAMNSTLEWFDPSGDQPLDALIAQIACLHWRGIRSDTADLECLP